MSENGGIGRHARLRTLWPLGCGGSTPPSRTLHFLLFLFLFIVTGCYSPPEKVVLQSLEHYSNGDIEEFCALLTPDSAGWFKGLTSLKNGGIFIPDNVQGVEMTIEKIDLIPDGVREKQSDGSMADLDLAIVSVKIEEDTVSIPLIKLREGWRIDLFSLADVWRGAAEKALPSL